MYDKYRIAEEEIKLSRNLKNLSNLLSGFSQTQHPRYLIESIANLEFRLASLQNKKEQ